MWFKIFKKYRAVYYEHMIKWLIKLGNKNAYNELKSDSFEKRVTIPWIQGNQTYTALTQCQLTLFGVKTDKFRLHAVLMPPSSNQNTNNQNTNNQNTNNQNTNNQNTNVKDLI